MAVLTAGECRYGGLLRNIPDDLVTSAVTPLTQTAPYCCTQSVMADEPNGRADADGVADVAPDATADEIMPDTFDASIEEDIKPPTDTLDTSMLLDSAMSPQANPLEKHVHTAESRLSAKKDATLREFLSKMDDYAPIVSTLHLDTHTPSTQSLAVPSHRDWQDIHMAHTFHTRTNLHQIPDAVTNYYLTLAGLPPPPQTPPHLARLLALATQKFIADIAADAYQYSRIRSTNTTSNNPLTGLGGAAGFGMMPAADEGKKGKDSKSAPLGGVRAGYGGSGGAGGGSNRTVLTMEDLGMAVGEYGVNVKRGEFYR